VKKRKKRQHPCGLVEQRCVARAQKKRVGGQGGIKTACQNHQERRNSSGWRAGPACKCDGRAFPTPKRYSRWGGAMQERASAKNSRR
jgi:hypothetical protein